MRLMRSLLFGVGENDLVTFGAITLVLLFVALVACYIPAPSRGEGRSTDSSQVGINSKPRLEAEGLADQSGVTKPINRRYRVVWSRDG